jgi:tRNA A-37 threonylcarbamoyl transferase component Bud32
LNFSLAPGEVVGRYQIRRRIGVGASAEVYEAEFIPLSRVVALKVLFPMLMTDPSAVEAFKSEARVVGQLDHPSIVRLYDFDVVDGRHFIAMQYVDGGSLQQLIDQLGPGAYLPVTRVISLITTLADALAFAHQAGVVHRDVKPSNVLLERSGSPMLADFGVARLFESSGMTRTSLAIGTPDYMSPEQVLGARLSPAADTYGLGVLAYQLVTGRLPFTRESQAAVLHAHAYELPTSPSAIRPDLPLQVESWITRALAKNPQERPNLAAAGQELGRGGQPPPLPFVAAESPATRIQPAIRSSASPRKHSGKLPLLGASLAIVAIVALAVFGVSQFLPRSLPTAPTAAPRLQLTERASAWIAAWNNAISTTLDFSPLDLPLDGFNEIKDLAAKSGDPFAPDVIATIGELASRNSDARKSDAVPQVRFERLRLERVKANDVVRLLRTQSQLGSAAANLQTVTIPVMPVFLTSSQFIMPISEFPFAAYRQREDRAIESVGWRRVFEPALSTSASSFFWMAIDVYVFPPTSDAASLSVTDQCEWHSTGDQPTSSTTISSPTVGDKSHTCRFGFSDGGRVFIMVLGTRNVELLVQNNPRSLTSEASAVDALVTLARTQVAITDRVAPR